MERGVRIKICGVTREEDVDLVSGSGADYIGLLVNMPSPRSLTPERAAALAGRSGVPVVLLFFDAAPGLIEETAREIRPAAIQLQGHETPEYAARVKELAGCEVWKGVHVPASGTGEVVVGEVLEKMGGYAAAGVDRLLLDTVVAGEGGGMRMGGTGKTYDWAAAERIARLSPRPLVMAGGLNSENIVEAIRTVRPWGVDLASGVEKEKGIKDPEKVALFISRARAAG